MGAPGQSTPFAFNVASTPESKPVFGGKTRNWSAVPGAVVSAHIASALRELYVVVKRQMLNIQIECQVAITVLKK